MVEISIIIPVFNGEKTIERALKSAINQDFEKKYEIIIINDGSTDKTSEILEKYKDKINIINQKNQGYLQAAIKGFQNSNGKFIIKLDADDEFEKNILSELYSSLEDESVAFAYPDYYEFNEETKEKKLIETGKNIFNTVAIGILFRKSVLEKLGFYDKNILFAEYDLLIRIMKKYKAKHVCKPLFTYYRSGKSITSKKDFITKAMDQIKKKYGEIPVRTY